MLSLRKIPISQQLSGKNEAKRSSTLFLKISKDPWSHSRIKSLKTDIVTKLYLDFR